MKHFLNLSKSFLLAWGTAVVSLLVFVVVLTIVTSEPVTWDDAQFAVTVTLIGTFIYVGASYLVIATPYYFSLIIKRPQITPLTHYVVTGSIAALVILAPFALSPGDLELATVAPILIAPLTAIVGTRTLIDRTKN